MFLWADFDETREEILDVIAADESLNDVTIQKTDLVGTEMSKIVAEEKDVVAHSDTALDPVRYIFAQFDGRRPGDQRRQPEIASWKSFEKMARKTIMGSEAPDSCILVRNNSEAVFLSEV